MPTSIYLVDNPPRTQQFRCPRRERPSGIIGIHTAESIADEVGPDAGAENVAGFIQRRTNYGSYHLLCDSDSIIQLVDYACVAYHIGTYGLNEHTIGISAACQAAKWNSYSKAWREATVRNMARGAARAARWLHRNYGITVPARRITLAQALAGQRGFLAHGDADPNRRTDPGSSFPWSLFLSTYAAEMAGTDPKDWFDMATQADLEAAVKKAVKEQLSVTGLVADTLPDAWNTSLFYLAGYGAMAASPTGRERQAQDTWAYRFAAVNPDGTLGDERVPAATHLRWTRFAVNAVRDDQARLHEKVDALIAAHQGLDQVSITELLERHHAERSQVLEAMAGQLDVLEANQAQIGTVLDEALSGERDATEALRALRDLIDAAVGDESDAPA